MSGEVGALRISLSLDSIDFTQGMQSINRRISALNTEFRAITAGAGRFDNSLEGLRSRSDVLTRTLETQQRKVEELRRRYDEARISQGEDADATVRLAAAYNRSVAAMRDTENRLNGVTQAIQRQSNPLVQMQRRLEETGQRLERFGGKMQSAGQDIATSFGAATAAIGGGLAISAKKAMDFESQMSSVKSVMSPDEANQFGKSLENLAITMGAKTKYSALEAAQGIEELIKAGVSVQDVMNGGLDGALSLATAGELDLGSAAEIASTALNAFKDDNLSVMQAADLLAGAANASATDVGELKFGLSAVAAVASGVGLNFKDTATSLAVFAQNGLKGQDAGTSLKTMLLNLTPSTKAQTEQFDALNLGTSNAAAGYKFLVDHGIKPLSSTVDDVNGELHKLAERQAGAHASASKVADAYEKLAKQSGFASSAFYDQNGKLKSLSDISGILQKALSGLNNEQRQTALQTMFGTDAIRAGNILYKEGAKGVNAMAEAMTKIKSADVAATKLDNVKGRIEQLKGSLETASISIGQALLPAIDKLTAKIQGMTDWFNKLSPSMKTTIVNTALVAAGITATVTAIGIGLAVIGSAVTGFGAIATAAATAAPLLVALTGPIGLVVAGLGLATVALLSFKKGSKESTDANLDHAKSLIDQQQSLETLTGQYDALRDKNQLSNYELLRFRDIQSELKTAQSADEIKKLKDEAEKLREKSGLSNGQLTEMLSLNDKLIEKVPIAGQAFSDQGNKILTNADDLHQANNKMRENIQLELELQKTKAEAKLDQNIRDQINNVDILNKKVIDLNNAKIEAAAKEFQLEQMKKQQQDAYAAGQKAIGDSMGMDITRLQQEVKIQNDNVNGVASEVQEKQKAVNKTTEQITKTQALFGEMINLQLAQAGINAKGQEGISQLDQAIKKTMDRKFELLRLSDQQGGLNQAQQKELDNLDSALGKYRTAKGSIKEIQSEQETVNKKIDDGTSKAGAMSKVLSGSEVKSIKFTGDGYREAKIISNEAGAGVKKEISVTDYGKTHSIDTEANKGASKTISIGASISNTFTKAVKAFEKMSGINIPGFATGTRNAPGGLAWVGENGPELTYLPRGAKVIPNRQSEQLLRNWNIPMLADGGVALSSGMALVGERGRELKDLRGASTQPLSNGSLGNQQPVIIEIPVYLDSVEIGRGTSGVINDINHSTFQTKLIVNGVR